LADSKSEQRNGFYDNTREFMEREQVSESGNDGWKNDVADSERFGQSGSWKHEQSISTEENIDWKADWPEYSGQGDFGWWNLEPDVGRVANGIPNRIHRLKGLGNAQVPLQAATAWRLLGGE
jgi:DNA (cytosine-5)-methyltransferase 1